MFKQMNLYEYKPFGTGAIFRYDGDFTKIIKLLDAKEFDGWLIESNGLLFNSFKFALFVKDGDLIFHSESFQANLDRDSVIIKTRQFFNLNYVRICVNGLCEKYFLRTPIRNLLLNDGMFPDEAEPIIDVLKRIQYHAAREKIKTLFTQSKIIK